MDNADFKLRQEASAIESGCPHFPSIFAFGGALDLIQSIGVTNIYNRIIELNKLIQKRIEEIGLEIIAPISDKHRSGILIIKTKNAKAVTQALAGKKIFVSARGEGIRVSFSFFNNEEDIDNFIREAEKIKEMF
jgi:selenocysteine lyase/cysteine desulfurase